MKNVFVVLFAGIVGCTFVQPVAAADAATWNESVLYSFSGPDGSEPVAGVIDVNGTLYGATSFGGNGRGKGDGTVFAVDTGTGGGTVLWYFGKPAFAPMAGLIAVKGKLYGTTTAGGSCHNYGHACGTVFSLDPATGTQSIVYGFCSRQDCADGRQPYAGLIGKNGLLYGTTFYGGAHAAGAVFSLDPGTGTETVLHSFVGGTDGDLPVSGLIDVNGKLYGTTESGGSGDCEAGSGCGTIFSIDLATGTETVVHAFTGADGAFPTAGLIDVNGILYGTAGFGGNTDTGCYGGTLGCGTVFSLDPATGTVTVIYAFSGPDGSQPSAGSLVEVNGTLYGATTWGGVASGDGGGTVFSLDPGTGKETVLHAFQGNSDGLYPTGLIAVKNKFYGTTLEGGNGLDGTVFVLKQKG